VSEAYSIGLRALAPELALTLTAFAVLLGDLFLGARNSLRAGWIALGGLGLTAALLLARAGERASTVFGMVEVDGFASYFKLLMTVGSAAVILLWMFDARERGAAVSEGHFLLLGALLGGFVIVGTNNALLLVLGFELLSIASYALAGYHKHRPESGEAAMKYIVFGGFATALMIYGLSLLYGLTGTLDFARMGAGDATASVPGLAAQVASDPLPVAIALVLVLAGFAYKISLAPLHFWAPDVYEGSPTPVTTFLAVVSKVAGIGALVRFLAALFGGSGVSPELLGYAGKLGLLLAILAAATMTLGNLAALRQAGLKRMLAYSSIAHAGYAMIGVACMNADGFEASLVYAAIYALMTGGAFALLIYFEGIVGSDRLEDLRGLGWRTPFAAAAMVILLASLVGIPPTGGFYGKYLLFVEGWRSGLGWLVLVAAINTVISLFYYFRVVRELFLAEPSSRIPAPARVLVFLSVAASLGVLVLGVWAAPLERWAAAGMEILRSAR
jgi:NADH-quinone oxidoreductase subunit N